MGTGDEKRTGEVPTLYSKISHRIWQIHECAGQNTEGWII